MSLFGRLQERARKIIYRYGADVEYFANGDGDYDPSTSSSEVIDPSFSTKGVVETIKERQVNGVDNVSVRIIVPASDFSSSPRVGDTLTCLMKTYRVVDVQHTIGGSEVVIYTLYVKQ